MTGPVEVLPALPRKRPPRWAVALLTVTLTGTLAGGLTAVTTLQPTPVAGVTALRGDVSRGGEDAASADAARLTAVRALLDVRARALQEKDVAGFVATVDPQATAYRTAQAAYVTNLEQVPLTQVGYDLDGGSVRGATPARVAAGVPSWSPAVTLRYELAGFDATPTSTRQVLTFVQRDGAWFVAADDDYASGGITTGRDLWDFGPVVVTRGASTLVLSHADHGADARALAAQVDAAVPPVSALWGTGWARTAVVQVPSSLAELGAVTGATGDLSGFAALQSSETQDPTHAVGGDRISVNPAAFFGSDVSVLGRQVVLRHELTHVASRRVTGSATPVWLAEGLADWVGFTGSGLPASSVARELLADLDAGKPTTGLPPDSAFTGGSPDIAQAYEQSWAFCSYVAKRFGNAKLVAFYTAVGTSAQASDPAVASASQWVLGTSFADVRAAWLAQLRTQLGG